MKYGLKLQRSSSKPERLEVVRSGSGVDSWMCDINECDVHQWLEGMKEKNEKLPVDLSFLEKLVAKWFWGATVIEKVNEIREDSPSIVRTYLCRNKKKEKFIILTVKNHSPYREETCGFTLESSLNSLTQWCEPVASGQRR